MANTKQPMKSEQNQVLPLCGVVSRFPSCKGCKDTCIWYNGIVCMHEWK